MFVVVRELTSTVHKVVIIGVNTRPPAKISSGIDSWSHSAQVDIGGSINNSSDELRLR